MLLFGERGLDKAAKAALLHFGGPQRSLPVVKIDASELGLGGGKIFGR